MRRCCVRNWQVQRRGRHRRCAWSRVSCCTLGRCCDGCSRRDCDARRRTCACYNGVRVRDVTTGQRIHYAVQFIGRNTADLVDRREAHLLEIIQHHRALTRRNCRQRRRRSLLTLRCPSEVKWRSNVARSPGQSDGHRGRFSWLGVVRTIHRASLSRLCRMHKSAYASNSRQSCCWSTYARRCSALILNGIRDEGTHPSMGALGSSHAGFGTSQ